MVIESLVHRCEGTWHALFFALASVISESTLVQDKACPKFPTEVGKSHHAKPNNSLRPVFRRATRSPHPRHALCSAFLRSKDTRCKERFVLKVGSINVATCVSLAVIVALGQHGLVKGFQPSQHNRQEAQKLWDTAITAKGGLDRLHQVNSLLIWYEETTRNVLGMVVHRGHVERLYVFPGKVWAWDDGLPPPFRLSVGFLNLEKNLSCRVYVDSMSPTCGNAPKSGSGEEIAEAQYLYLMETKWIKPTPIRVGKETIGFKTLDVLEAQLADKRIVYFLNRRTHLPQRVDVYHGASKRARVSLEFSNYVTVDGIQMPSKQKRGRINFLMNPPYDEAVFSHAPSISAGPKAWQKAR